MRDALNQTMRLLPIKGQTATLAVSQSQNRRPTTSKARHHLRSPATTAGSPDPGVQRETVGQTSSVGAPVLLCRLEIAGTFGPVLLIVGLITGHGVWLGVALCCIRVLDLGFDAVRRRRR